MTDFVELPRVSSFFATLKSEFYYRRVWTTRKRAMVEVGAWNEDRHNRRQRHSSIGQISPVSFELQYSHQSAKRHWFGRITGRDMRTGAISPWRRKQRL